MSQHDLVLLAIALVVILAVVVSIARFRVHPFPALVIGALILGLWSGAPADLVLKSFRVGFGETLANVGVLLALGAMFGALLASSGGAEQVSSALLRVGGIRMVPWTMCAVSMILGLPLFFEAGVVLMMPIILSVGTRLAQDPQGLKGNAYILAGLPVFAGISVLHALVPPHPGPMVAIDALKADLGTTLILGLLISLPIAVVAGPLYTLWIAPRSNAAPPVDLVGPLSQTHPRLPAAGPRYHHLHHRLSHPADAGQGGGRSGAERPGSGAHAFRFRRQSDGGAAAGGGDFHVHLRLFPGQGQPCGRQGGGRGAAAHFLHHADHRGGRRPQADAD